jgi:hypothetical protein
MKRFRIERISNPNETLTLKKLTEGTGAYLGLLTTGATAVEREESHRRRAGSDPSHRPGRSRHRVAHRLELGVKGNVARPLDGSALADEGPSGSAATFPGHHGWLVPSSKISPHSLAGLEKKRG